MNLKFNLLELLLHDHEEGWGINFFCISKDFRDYSLFRFEFRLPNGTHIRKFTVDYWDVMFMSNYLRKEYRDLSDHYLWSFNKHPKGWDKIKLNILSKFFR